MLKICLVIYTLYAVVINIQNQKTIEKILRFDVISDNFGDLMIIGLQIYGFFVKYNDKSVFDYDSNLILFKEMRY